MNPPEMLQFQKCARGYLISSGDRFVGTMGQLYAFDRVEDAAAWIVEQYTSPIEKDGEAA